MSNRPSPMQLEGFVDFLEQNPGIAKGLLRTAQAKMETKRKWASMTLNLNALGGAIKDGQGWAKYWAEKKCALKKHCAQVSASMRRTGGGPAKNLPTLSALDQRLVAVMGGHNFATGDPNLSINPFPELNVPAESSVNEQSENVHHSLDFITEEPGHSHLDTSDTRPTTAPIPASSSPPLASNVQRPRRRRHLSVGRSVDAEMEQFASMEARRVEAELISAQALNKLAEAAMLIADALREIARKIKIIYNGYTHVNSLETPD